MVYNISVLDYNINYFKQKIKSLWANYKEELLVCLIIILVGIASYNLGILSAQNGHPNIEIRNIDGAIENGQIEATNSDSSKDNSNATTTISKIVASKNGKAYYFSNCAGVGRISDKNKIYFASEDEALKAGYYLAANCKNN